MIRKRLRSVHAPDQQKGDCNLEDRISQLQDEILISILSFMPLQEAAVTSVLSSRWRYLWASISSLDFDGAKTMEDTGSDFDRLKKERSKFIRWVNRVIELHNGPSLEEFRLVFDLGKNSKHDIDLWLEFALSKRVQRLALDFWNPYVSFRQRPYDLPPSFLSNHMLLEHNRPRLCRLQPCSLLGFKSLKSLDFNYLNVPEGFIEYIFSNCPVLESLRLIRVEGLRMVKVIGPSLRLKNLEILDCFLDRTEICDHDLISFSYLGPRGRALLKNVPYLVKLSILLGDPKDLIQVQCCFSQLEHLKLTVSFDWDNSILHQVGELTKLKELDLSIFSLSDDDSLLEWIPLLKAAPCLQKFGIQVRWAKRIRRELRTGEKCPLPNLKVVEVSGYSGCTREVEFIIFLLENAPALQTIIVNPIFQFECPDFLDDSIRIKNIKKGRDYAERQLPNVVPAHINLVIL